MVFLESMSALNHISKKYNFKIIERVFLFSVYLDYRWRRTVRRWPTAGRLRWDVPAWLSHHTTDIRNKVTHGSQTDYSTHNALAHCHLSNNTRHTCLREEQWRRHSCVSRKGRVQTGRAQQQPAAARVQLERTHESWRSWTMTPEDNK